MGRRKKSVALNQTSVKPVEEPKTEAKVIISEEITEDLKDIHGVDDVNKTLSKENMGVTEDGIAIHPDNFPKEESIETEEIKILEEGAGLVYSKDYVEDPTIERKLVDKSHEEPEKIETQKLSIADKRRKLRHGMKPPTH